METEPRKRKKPRFDQQIKKETAKELAKLMYEDIHNANMHEEKGDRDKTWESTLENLKEQNYGKCQYCGRFVKFDGTKHREQTLDNRFFWIANCPECNGENWENIFLVKRKMNTGFGEEVVWLTDYKWYRREDVLSHPASNTQPIRQDKSSYDAQNRGKISFGVFKHKQ